MATLATPAAAPVSRPSRLLALSEGQRALFELATLPLASPLLLSAPRGDGHPVMVIPGFMASDRSTGVLRRYLKALGYDAHCWDLGRNLGHRSIGNNGEHLVEKLAAIHEKTGKKVSLVGWSLGGAIARQLGQRMPGVVRQVVTLGSPLRGDPRSTSVWRLYEMATGEKVTGSRVRDHMEEIAQPPPVPVSAVYSKADGVVPWRNCMVDETERSENIEVYGSHVGLGVNGTVLYAVADRLAQPEGAWTRFDPAGLRGALYPSRK